MMTGFSQTCPLLHEKINPPAVSQAVEHPSPAEKAPPIIYNIVSEFLMNKEVSSLQQA